VILGNEAAGVVESVGEGVAGIRPGDRVAYAGMSGEFFGSTGSYAERRNVPAERLISLPDGLSDHLAAAVLMKGLTASIIVNKVARLRQGDAVLIHAAASGMGLILCQWAKHLGATVIGTVGSQDKAKIASEHGCDHTILYREVDFAQAVLKIANTGVAAVFDAVGKDTFLPSLACVRPFGILVNYGNTSGAVPPLDIRLLAKPGSISVCRVGVGSLTGKNELMQIAAKELFDLVGSGVLKVRIGQTYSLRDAANAHRDIESRQTTGSTLLLP
jgi:NADPH2:quinone reductase